MKKLITAITATTLSACTFDDGKGFATLETASLSARFEPGPARDLGNGAVLSDLGYQVSLTHAALTTEELALNELRGGAGADVSFDPAHPPPGYSLCHGGHCHAEDGRLVDYAEIEAELAGGAARFYPVARLPAAHAFDVLAGETVALDVVVPSRELPRVRLTQLSLSIARIEIEGSVTGGPQGGGLGTNTATLLIALPIESSIDEGLSLSIDRDQPGAFTLAAALEIDGTLFDGIDFSALQSAARIEIVDRESPAGIALAGALIESPIAVVVQ